MKLNFMAIAVLFIAIFLLGFLSGFILKLNRDIPGIKTKTDISFITKTEQFGIFEGANIQLRGKLLKINSNFLTIGQDLEDSIDVSINPEIIVLSNKIERVKTGEEIREGDVSGVAIEEIREGDDVVINCSLEENDCLLTAITQILTIEENE